MDRGRHDDYTRAHRHTHTHTPHSRAARAAVGSGASPIGAALEGPSPVLRARTGASSLSGLSLSEQGTRQQRPTPALPTATRKARGRAQGDSGGPERI